MVVLVVADPYLVLLVEVVIMVVLEGHQYNLPHMDMEVVVMVLHIHQLQTPKLDQIAEVTEVVLAGFYQIYLVEMDYQIA